MMNRNTMIIIAVVIILVVVGGYYLMKKNVRENFLNHAFTYKVERNIGSNRGDLYAVPGSMQSMLSPRFSNVDYGAHIRYNMPAYNNLGVPANPIGYSNMVNDLVSPGNMAKMNGMDMNRNNMGSVMSVRENYCNTCPGGCRDVVQCQKGGQSMGMSPMSQMSMSSSYMNSLNNLDYTPTSDLLPVPNMKTMNMMGQMDIGSVGEQPVVYDRFMYANQKSRLNALGDPIRGDLPIVPHAPGWFSPSAVPNIDLRQGALSVMGGADNATANALHSMINVASGGVSYALGGLNYARDTDVSLGNGQRDVTVTSFP